jgi:hypothetical protein
MVPNLCCSHNEHHQASHKQRCCQQRCPRRHGQAATAWPAGQHSKTRMMFGRISCVLDIRGTVHMARVQQSSQQTLKGIKLVIKGDIENVCLSRVEAPQPYLDLRDRSIESSSIRVILTVQWKKAAGRNWAPPGA